MIGALYFLLIKNKAMIVNITTNKIMAKEIFFDCFS
jgi:hypothetical protein